MEREFDISTFVDVLTEDKVLCNLVNRMIKKRKAMKITQKKLAMMSGVSYGSVKRFELTGEISLRSLLKIASALDSLEGFEKLFSEITIRNVKELFYDKWSK